MRAVVQRVLSASVDVEGKRVSTIGPGLLCLIGIKDGDTEADAEYICKKILTSKLFENEDTERAWDKNVVDRNYEVGKGAGFRTVLAVGDAVLPLQPQWAMQCCPCSPKGAGFWA